MWQLTRHPFVGMRDQLIQLQIKQTRLRYECRIAAEFAAKGDRLRAELAAKEDRLRADIAAQIQAEFSAKEGRLMAEVAAKHDQLNAEWERVLAAREAHGIPSILVSVPRLGVREGRLESTASSNRSEPATIYPRPFTILDSLPEPISRPSVINTWLSLNKNLNWTSETAIAHYVQMLLTDIAAAFGLEMSVTAEMSWSGRKPDLWIVSMRGIPIGVVEVKAPGAPDVMEYPGHFGQLFDYVMQKREYEVSMLRS